MQLQPNSTIEQFAPLLARLSDGNEIFWNFERKLGHGQSLDLGRRHEIGHGYVRLSLNLIIQFIIEILQEILLEILQTIEFCLKFFRIAFGVLLLSAEFQTKPLTSLC